MCGIAGIVKFSGDRVDVAELRVLNNSIFHRGPDDEGYYTDANVGFAMRRLSIIDIAGGRQPISSRDGNLVIVFNGEIYNYRELRKELESHSHIFNSNSDTEVALLAYQTWGDKALDRLNGMWGMAIYDKQKREIFLSRDRLGKKQIYYAINRDSMVFGSEMRIPMLYDDENRRIRLSALPEFLTYGYIGGEETALQNIRLLPEGSWMRIGLDGKVNAGRYWSVLNCKDRYPAPGDENEAAEMAYSLLKDAVNIRLVSDVPVSLMLSSGLDSTACSYILAKELGVKLTAFTLGFDDKDFDESADAGDFAKWLGLQWESRKISVSDIKDNFQSFIEHCGSMNANTGQLVYFFVNKMIHDAGFKVAINASGGDELFAGYKTYQADTLFKYWRWIPDAAKRAIRSAASTLPPSLGRVSFDYMAKKFSECPYESPLKAHAYWRTIFSQDELRRILSPSVMETAPSFTRIYDEAFKGMGGESGSINNFLRADIKAWLTPLMPFTDNMSMAHSVELRMPFLDYRLVEMAVDLPSKFLFGGWKLKKIIKRFLKGRIPNNVLYRGKRGTHLPIGRWLNLELADIADYYLDGKRLNSDGVFNMAEIRGIVDAHRNMKADNTFKIWNLIIFSAWKERNRACL